MEYRLELLPESGRLTVCGVPKWAPPAFIAVASDDQLGFRAVQRVDATRRKLSWLIPLLDSLAPSELNPWHRVEPFHKVIARLAILAGEFLQMSDFYGKILVSLRRRKPGSGMATRLSRQSRTRSGADAYANESRSSTGVIR
jgi:hypothetical protein